MDGRATSCASLDEALDLLASKAVVLRRRLGGTPTAPTSSAAAWPIPVTRTGR